MARIWNKHKTNTPLKRKVFVAMSGGVDSSVAALLLKQEGYDVRGIYMKEWVPPGIECVAGDDRLMAARVAAHLDIPFAVWDFSEDYRREVAEYMLREYAEGRTPNPDVMCNKEIKFGIFLQKALKAGADYIATGHYIRNRDGVLRIAKDTNKDQTYFLWTLTQEQLQYCLFPVGEYTKPQVRGIAQKAHLPSWDKKDSQGVCFVGKFDFAEFLRMQIPRREGMVVTPDGKEIGTHDGLSFYTPGQRHGVSVGGNAAPLYVAEKDSATNTLVIAEEADPILYKRELSAWNINWISGKAPELPLKCEARIRYRQPLQACSVELLANSHKLKAASVKVTFTEAQRAVASGQSIVFYQNGEMLGGGIIDVIN